MASFESAAAHVWNLSATIASGDELFVRKFEMRPLKKKEKRDIP